MNYAAIATHSPAFADWIRANNDADLQGILGCYGSSVTMFATFDNIVPKPQDRDIYFQTLLSNPNLNVLVNSIKSEKHGNTVVLCGDYTFTHYKGGQENIVPARFTMVIENNKITHHHSSAITASDLTSYMALHEIDMHDLNVAESTVDGFDIAVGSCKLNILDRTHNPDTSYRVTKVSKGGSVIHLHLSSMPKLESAFNIGLPSRKNLDHANDGSALVA